MTNATTTNKKPMTNVEMMKIAVQAMIEVGAPEEAIEKGKRHLEVLSKPRTKTPGAETPRHRENVQFAKRVYEMLPDEPVGGEWFDRLVGFIPSSQRRTSVAKVAKEDLGLWESFKDGRKTMYRKMV